LIGGVASGVTDIPEGMYLTNFPATDYMVVTHEWMQSIDEAEQQVGRIVGFAHGNELQLPDGYVKYNGPPSPLMFIESYNYEFDNNRFRFEVWLPIKVKA
jgi:predicted transcriptional regulator YdeE